MYPFKNDEKYLQVEQYLLDVVKKKGITIPTHRMRLAAGEMMVSSKYSAGGSSNLLNGNVAREVGVSNFDGNKLETDRYFVIDGVTIAYGEGNAADKVYAVSYDKDVPSVLLSSNLVVRQNGQVLISLPIVSIINAKKKEDFYRNLNGLVLLEPNQPVEIIIESPVGSSITPSTGDTSFVRVLLKGYETLLR